MWADYGAAPLQFWPPRRIRLLSFEVRYLRYGIFVLFLERSKNRTAENGSILWQRSQIWFYFLWQAVTIHDRGSIYGIHGRRK